MGSCMQRIASVLALALFVLAVLMAPTGASAKVGESCGGFIGPILCGKGEFCQRPTGQCVGIMPGACAAKPRICPLFVKPVCGCNGKTYSNDCRRMQAGVSKLHDGKCKKA